MKEIRKLSKLMGKYDLYIILALLMTPVSLSKSTFGDAGLIASGNLFRIMFAGIAMGLVFLSVNPTKGLRIRKPKGVIKWFVAYWLFGIFSFASSYWLSYSIVKYIEYGVLIVVTLYLFTKAKYNPSIFNHAFDLSILYIKIMLLIVVLGLVISPSRAILIPDAYNPTSDAILPFQLQGWIIPLSNTAVCFYAGYAFYVTFVQIVEAKQKKMISYLEIILYAIIAVLSMSRMALLGAAIACFIYIFFFCKKGNVKLLVFLAGTIIVILGSNLIITFMLRGQSVAEVSSVTGRTKWWAYAIEVYFNGTLWEKIFGFGFAAGERVVARASSDLMSTLDSDYFANLISCGAVGLFCILGAIVTSVRQLLSVPRLLSVSNYNQKMYIFKAAGIMIITLIRLFTVTTFSLLTVYLIIFVFSTTLIYMIGFQKRVIHNE